MTILIDRWPAPRQMSGHPPERPSCPRQPHCQVTSVCPDELLQIRWHTPGENARIFVRTNALLLRRGLSSQGPQSGAPVRFRFGITATPAALGCSCRAGCCSELAGFYWLLLLAAAGCSWQLLPTDPPGLMGAHGGCQLLLVLLVSAPDYCSLLLLLLLLEALTPKS